MKEKKKFILCAKTWHIGYYTGTVEEMCDVLSNLGIEVTKIIDIAPEIDLGITYNRAICTKMKVLSYDEKAKEQFLDEYKQLVKKYSTDKKKYGPGFAYGEIDQFFRERPIETDAIDVLIADDTTFRSSRKEAGRTVCYLSQRDFEPCSALNEEDLWDYLREHCYFQKP